MQSVAILHGVGGGGNGVGADGNVIAVDAVDVGTLQFGRKEWLLYVVQAIPTHLWHLEVEVVRFGNGEAKHGNVENAQAIYVALLGVVAEELHSHTDAQHGLAERADDLIETRLTEVSHGG